MDLRSSHLWMLHTTLTLHIWWHKCKSASVSFLFFSPFFSTSVSVSSYCISADLSGAPGCSPSCGVWGESVSTNLWNDHMWKRENTCGCPSAIIIGNTSSSLETLLFQTSSPLPVVYPDLREIPPNSLFVSFKITFKSRCWAPLRWFRVWRRIWKQLRW